VIEIGNWLIDGSIFRTAYSDGGHPVLASHVANQFGEGKGAFLCKIERAIAYGFRYVPKYVLTQSQVDAVGRGALKKVDERTAGDG
jgi:hypothetical protein